MDKLRQEGQINLAASLICFIILFVTNLIGVFLVTDPILKFFTIAFGSFIPGFTIASIWTDNFGKWFLEKRKNSRKHII